MKLKSFGCSFTYGSDLSDCDFPMDHSCLTWTALLATSLNYDYECYAKPGIGNLQIYQSIIDHVYFSQKSEIFVINWTWLDRFDFMDPVAENWHTIRPGDNSTTHQLYYKHFYNQYHSMITNAAYISSVILLLEKYNIKFIMSLTDATLFDVIDPQWQDPRSISLLQKEIKPYITWFENDTFLNWSKKKGFPISETLHPLEDAHQAAFELIRSYNLV
jgi:hypothetical protein